MHTWMVLATPTINSREFSVNLLIIFLILNLFNAVALQARGAWTASSGGAPSASQRCGAPSVGKRCGATSACQRCGASSANYREALGAPQAVALHTHQVLTKEGASWAISPPPSLQALSGTWLESASGSSGEGIQVLGSSRRLLCRWVQAPGGSGRKPASANDSEASQETGPQIWHWPKEVISFNEERTLEYKVVLSPNAGPVALYENPVQISFSSLLSRNIGTYYRISQQLWVWCTVNFITVGAIVSWGPRKSREKCKQDDD